MQVSVEKTSELSRKMTVHLPEEQVQEKVADRLRKLAREANLKGFRPGKAPQHVIKKMYGAQVRAEVLGELIRSSYVDALKDQEQKPVAPPNIVQNESVTEGDGFEYVAEFEVYPDVSLDNLEQIEVTTETAAIEEADIDKMLENLREQKKAWKDSEQPARAGDRVTICFSGVADGENFTDGKVEDYSIVIGSGQMIPGFEDNLLDLGAGDNKTFEITFPEQYGNKELAGKNAVFELEVNKVETSVLPVIDAEFMRDYGIEDGDMEAFRNEIKANMQRELKQAIRAKTKKAVLDKLYQDIEVILPKVLVDQEIENLMRPFKENAAKQNQDLDLPADTFEKQARKRVALSLIMAEIISANKIRIDEDRVRSMIEEIAQSYEQPEALINYYYGDEKRLQGIRQLALEEQAVDWVLEQVKINEESVDFDTLMKRAQ